MAASWGSRRRTRLVWSSMKRAKWGEDVESEQGGDADYSARYGFDDGEVAVNVEVSYRHGDSGLAG